MQQQNSKDERFIKKIKVLLADNDLSRHMELVKQLSIDLKISHLECAAALSLLIRPSLSFSSQTDQKVLDNKENIDLLLVLPKPKLVRYRLDIGYKHLLTLDKIHEVLVEVAGVDKKNIGNLDIRKYYTLVELPDGMPADIFQLLSETEIHNQKLDIKRIKSHRRFQRRNNKKRNMKERA